MAGAERPRHTPVRCAGERAELTVVWEGGRGKVVFSAGSIPGKTDGHLEATEGESGCSEWTRRWRVLYRDLRVLLECSISL